MVRKALSAGPSLFCEWAVGSTVDSAVRKLRRERLERDKEEAEQERDVIKVEVMTDGESETDSMRVTYPRKGRKGGGNGTAKAPSGTKQVRFKDNTLKPALRKKEDRRRRAHASSGSDTLVSESDSGTDTRSVTAVDGHPSSEESASDKRVSRRCKLRKASRARSTSSGDSDDDSDNICSDCGDGVAKKRTKARRSKKYDSDPESSTGSEKVRRRSREEKRKLLEKEHSSRRSGSHRSTPVEVDCASDQESREVSSRSKKHGSKEHSKGASKGKGLKSSTSPDQKPYPEAMPGPHMRRPNFIRPVRAEVMQVEHTVEGPEDPRPNAFVDERNNIVRVYHGPAFGNPFGKLYPRRNSSLQPLPVGVPHPLENQYYHGFGSPQKHDQSQSPMGHIATTLGGPYPSVFAGVGPRPHTNMAAEQADLRDGLWGIGPGANTTSTKDKPASWNNVGPPKPSASLREANPTSRWGFGSSKKGGDHSGASQKADDGGNANGGWDDAGNQSYKTGGNEGVKWDSGADNNFEGNAAGDDNTGNTGQNWGTGNDESGNNDAWNSSGNQGGNQGGSWSPDKDKSGSGWDAGNAQNNGGWDSNGNNNDSTWNDNNNDNNNEDANYGATSGSWNADANNDSSWKIDANDNASAKSASNNVGFSGTSNAGTPPSGPSGPPQGNNVYGRLRNHMPGSWEDASPVRGGGAPFPDWRDTSAAQSTMNW